MDGNAQDIRFADIENSILFKEGMAQMLLASAQQERRLLDENRRLKQENACMKRRLQEREQPPKLPPNTSIVIQHADHLALGDNVQNKVQPKNKNRHSHKRKSS